MSALTVTAKQKEGWTLNVASLFLSLANFSGGSSVPFVLPLVALALSLYALRLFRKIQREGPE